MTEKDFNNMIKEFSTIVKKYTNTDTIPINELLENREERIEKELTNLYKEIKNNKIMMIEKEKEIANIKHITSSKEQHIHDYIYF